MCDMGTLTNSSPEDTPGEDTLITTVISSPVTVLNEGMITDEKSNEPRTKIGGMSVPVWKYEELNMNVASSQPTVVFVGTTQR